MVHLAIIWSVFSSLPPSVPSYQGSPISQHGLELTMQLKRTLNFRLPWMMRLHAHITVFSYMLLGYAPGFLACWANILPTELCHTLTPLVCISYTFCVMSHFLWNGIASLSVSPIKLKTLQSVWICSNYFILLRKRILIWRLWSAIGCTALKLASQLSWDFSVVASWRFPQILTHVGYPLP